MFTVRDEGGVLYIDNVQMTKQRGRSDALHLSTDPGELALWLSKQGEEHGWGSGECMYANWGQWHSHANAAVGRSAEDDQTVREYVTHGWYVTLIVNKKGDVHCSVDTMAGSQGLEHAVQLTFDGELELYVPVSDERVEALKAERTEMYDTYSEAVVIGGGVGDYRSAHYPSKHHNVEQYRHSAGKFRYVCKSCKRLPSLCQCKGKRVDTVYLDANEVQWPVKGRVPAGIRRDGYSVKFYHAGDITVTLKKGGRLCWLNPGRSSDRVFLRCLGINQDIITRFVQSGKTIEVEPGAREYIEVDDAGWQCRDGSGVGDPGADLYGQVYQWND